MPILPLKNILKGRLMEIAELQDRIVLSMVKNLNVVFHGGTAIWRIYGGKRFSFDLDVYCENPEKLAFLLEKEFRVVRKKITPGGVLYLRIEEGKAITEVEASPRFREIETREAEFHLVDGSNILVLVLTPEDLVKEKVLAFKGRGKARDLYDIYYLLPLCDPGKIKPVLQGFRPKKPQDWDELREIILLGVIPGYESVLSRIEKYAKNQV